MPGDLPIDRAIADLGERDPNVRAQAARSLYDLGCAVAGQASAAWVRESAFATLLAGKPTVGVAVRPGTFERIRAANGSPPLALVPPDQDAQEFELHFPEEISLDILTTRAPGSSGAIARYLDRRGEGVQQVELPVTSVDRATAVLRERFALEPIYPATRAGADGSRVNFFLVPSLHGKVLIELVETASTALDHMGPIRSPKPGV